VTICQVRLATSVLIRATRDGAPPSPRQLERVLKLIQYHQANIKAANESHARRRKGRLRNRGVALDQLRSCQLE